MPRPVTGRAAIALFEVLTAPWRLTVAMIDGVDERVARRRRQSLGQRRWLLSWSRDPDGRWRARLSGPETVRTIERVAATRTLAILRTVRALERLPRLRQEVGPRAVAEDTVLADADSDQEADA